MRVRLFQIIVISVITLLLPARLNSSEKPQPVGGLLDLRSLTIDNSFIISLNGEWEFYWMELLRPHHFISDTLPPSRSFINVPSYWTASRATDIYTTPHGYATYRLRVLLPPNTTTPLGLDLKVMDSSYDLYIDGIYLGSNGVPGTSEGNTIPSYTPRIYRHTPLSDTLDILINVSNFHHRRGGFWLPAELGAFERIQPRAAKRFGISIASSSVIAAFSLMFLLLFIAYPKERVSLFFALTLTGIILRSIASGEMVIDLVAGNLEWISLIRIEYIGTNIALAGGFLFLAALYPYRINRLLSYIALTISLVSVLIILLTDVNTFSHLAAVHYTTLSIFGLASISSSTFSLIRRARVVDAIYLAAFMVLVVAIVHDILIATDNIRGDGRYISSEVMIIFIVIQSVLIFTKLIRSFAEKEKYRLELQELNRELEAKVALRTDQLSKAKDEAEVHALQIEKHNRKLAETVALKNRVFGVIAHDLRSPVVNILYILNLLKEEESKERQASLMNSSIEYSQSVITLLENMLVWGRGQEGKIKYSPDYYDLVDIVLTNIGIYKEVYARKEVKISFTHRGKVTAFVDKDLIDIIIRNLISNAVKYSPRGGRVSILLTASDKDPDNMILKVCDRGAGIERELADKILKGSDIISRPGTEKEKGTGLGLKLSCELARINGGRIELISTPGEGSCFSVVMPVTAARVSHIPPEEE